MYELHVREQQQGMRSSPSTLLRQPGAVTIAWQNAEMALAAWHALRALVIEANRHVSDCVQAGNWARAEGLLRPALNAVRQTSHQHGWPVRLLQTLSALNAASLCGMHLAAGKPAAAWQAGSYALEMEAQRGDGDNPVGLRLSMAAAAYMLGRHAASITLLRQAARIGLMQLRGLQV